MQLKLSDVVLIFFAISNVFAKPISQNIDDSSIETPMIDITDDLTDSQSAQLADCSQHSPNGLNKYRRGEDKPQWCQSRPQGSFRRVQPEWYVPIPHDDHPKDECPYPEYPILVTCPLDYGYLRGRLEKRIIGGYERLVREYMDQCAPGELI